MVTSMEWLNYHHLLYFWTVAREGSVARASEHLRSGAADDQRPNPLTRARARREALRALRTAPGAHRRRPCGLRVRGGDLLARPRADGHAQGPPDGTARAARRGDCRRGQQAHRAPDPRAGARPCARPCTSSAARASPTGCSPTWRCTMWTWCSPTHRCRRRYGCGRSITCWASAGSRCSRRRRSPRA